MKKRIQKFNYDMLRPMDMVVCAGRSPFAAITRLVTAGGRKMRDHSVAVHTGCLVDFRGQLLVAEMGPKGLGINSLHKYKKVGGRRWVIGFRRNKIYDNKDIRGQAQDRIAYDRRHTLEYDFKGLLEFVFKKVKDNKMRFYCSEYYYTQTLVDKVKYPPSFVGKVSPYDLQLCSGFNDVEGWLA